MKWKQYDYKYSISRTNWTGRVFEGNVFKCSFCRGIGVLPGTKGTKCHVCYGRGEINLKGPVVVCAYCKGMGDYPQKTNLTCPVCRGRGLLPVNLPVEKCLDCGGAGRIRGAHMPCRKCRGAGVVHKDENTIDKDTDYEN